MTPLGTNNQYSALGVLKTIAPWLVTMSLTYPVHKTNILIEEIRKDYFQLKNKIIEQENLISELKKKLYTSS